MLLPSIYRDLVRCRGTPLKTGRRFPSPVFIGISRGKLIPASEGFVGEKEPWELSRSGNRDTPLIRPADPRLSWWGGNDIMDLTRNRSLEEAFEMKKRILISVVIILLIAFCGFYFSRNIGIAEDKINQAQMETVSWEKQDYIVTGTSDGGSLYVGVMYMKDDSDAKYFIYVKKSGLSFGWHLLQSGGLTEGDGLMAFDCGEYGIAYVALNQNNKIQKIEFEDGREPTENVGNTICERSKSAVFFYDASGTIVEPTKVTVET
jgi:hypothetical protein